MQPHTHRQNHVTTSVLVHGPSVFLSQDFGTPYHPLFVTIKSLTAFRCNFKGHFTLTRTIHTNNSRERSPSSFGLSIHTHANVRTNCSREQFASFTLSNAIRANNLQIKLIFD